MTRLNICSSLHASLLFVFAIRRVSIFDSILFLYLKFKNNSNTAFYKQHVTVLNYYTSFVRFSMLGQGAFGEVYEGRLRNLCANVRELPVAVKVMKLSFPLGQDGFIVHNCKSSTFVKD